MRQKASTVGNIVGKNVPVSLTEVRICIDVEEHQYLRRNLGRQRYPEDMAP